MLQTLRNSGQNWLGKLLTAVLFGLLILSFAIWGIADWVNNPGGNTVATVGNRTISTQDVREAYNTSLQQLQQQTRSAITPEMAQAMGLDRQVLSRLVGQAALDNGIDSLGLAVSDTAIARSIMDDRQFRDSSGNFNRSAFEAALLNANMTERDFVDGQREILPRRQFVEAFTAGLQPPAPMQAAVHRFISEQRDIRHFTLGTSAAGTIADPDDSALQTWFDARKAQFSAPEYRSVNLLVLSPEALAKPDAVTEEDARARYETDKVRLFGTPETRHLRQIVFPSAEDARKAHERLAKGEADFAAIAAERNITASDYDLGQINRQQVIDPAVAEAAFALAAPGVTDPINGRFGTVLVEVVAISPASVRPFEDVAGDVRQLIARERAASTVDSLHDRIEDMRASAQPLADIVKTLEAETGLALRTIASVDRNGSDPDGNAIDLPERDTLIEAAFNSDVGADNAALRTQSSAGNGYLWFDVTDVTPARDRTLDEVRAAVLERWREEATADKLAEIARGLVERLDAGEAADAVAASVGSTVETASGLTRNAQTAALPSASLTQAFGTNVGKAGSTVAPGGRVVYQVASASIPPFDPASPQAQAVNQQLASALPDDILASYIARQQADLRPTFNEQSLRAAIGGTTGARGF